MSCNMKFKKSTLDIYSLSTNTLAPNEIVEFDNENLTGCSIDVNRGMNTIVLCKPGLYLIEVSANAAFLAATGATTTISKLGLVNKGVEVPAAYAILSATSITNVGFSTIIEVPPSCCAVNNSASLTIENIGDNDIVLNSINVNVVKLA